MFEIQAKSQMDVNELSLSQKLYLALGGDRKAQFQVGGRFTHAQAYIRTWSLPQR